MSHSDLHREKTNEPGRRPRRRRLLWFALGGLGVVLLAAALIVPALLDVERYRGRIEQALASATGWQAELGTIDFSPWRGMVLTVSPAGLHAPGESSRVDIETIEIRADIWPLFRGLLNVRSITLVNPDIVLVRPDARQGWVLPLGGDAEPTPSVAEPDTTEPSSAPPATGSGFSVAIDQIRVNNGRLRVEDREGESPLELELTDLDLTIAGPAPDVSGSGELAGGGSLEWQGNPDDGITVQFSRVPTERLHAFVGPDLVHSGGDLAGTVHIDLPLRIVGNLTGSRVTLMEGERPFDAIRVDVAVSASGPHWRMDDLKVDADGVLLTGAGTLLPDLALDVELPRTPLESVLRASESVLPLPLDAEPPGTVESTLRIEQPEGGALVYMAEGALSAASFRASEMLPPARDVEATFVLNRDGELEVRLLNGTVGGGPARGVARLSSVAPPGTLAFEGGLQDAVLGALLHGFLGDAADKISGPTGLNAALALDLGATEIDARSLAGRLDLEAQQVSLPGWDLEQAIRRKIEEELSGSGLSALIESKLSGDKPSEPAAQPTGTSSVLDDLAVNVDFDSWPWKLEQLRLSADAVTANGTGTFDPIAGVVDVNFTARLNRQRTAELVEKTRELKLLVDDSGQITLPLHLQGPMVSPGISVDLGQALASSIDEEDAEETVKGLIKGLLDR